MENQNQTNSEISEEEKAKAEAEVKAKEEAEAKAAAEAEAKKNNILPRHEGKVKVKPKKTYQEIEAKKQIESVKLWSQDILEAQIESKVCSPEMKKACAEELKKREDFRKSKVKK